MPFGQRERKNKAPFRSFRRRLHRRGGVLEGVTKLGKLEHEAFDLISETCDGYCKYTDAYNGMEGGQERLEAKCAECPLEKLADMIWRG